MPTPTHAMLWELWRLSRWEMAQRTLGPAALWGGALFLLGGAGDGVGATILTIPIFMLTVMTSMFSSLWMDNFDNRGRGFAFYLGFTRPVSTWRLVAIPMTYCALTTALCYLVPAALLRAVFGLQLPLFPVAALITAACAVFIMAVWSPRGRLTRTFSLIATTLAFFALVIFGMMKNELEPDAFLNAKFLLEQFRFSAAHYLLLLAVFAGAIAVTTIAVDRQRHGERWMDAQRTLTRMRVLSPRLTRNHPFASSRHAQFWFEMRRSGLPLLQAGTASALALLVTMVTLSATGALSGKSPLPVWILVLLLSPPAFTLIGAEWLLGLRHKQGAVALATFDATQPMGNGELIAIKMLALAAGVGASWLAMVLAAGAWLLCWSDGPTLHRISELMAIIATVSPLWGACAICKLLVTFVAAQAAVMAGGLFTALHPKVMAALVCSGGGYGLLALWDAKHGWALRPFWDAHAWALAITLIVVTIVFWHRTLSQKFLSRSHFVALLGVWILYAVATVALGQRLIPSIPPIPASATAMAYASLLAPLTAVAAATLALAAHRHR